MSIQKRRITYWSIEFIDEDTHSFDPDLFRRFMLYVAALDESERLETHEKTNKAIALESVKEETKHGIHMLKAVFKSCKFNHSPDYMSSKDGSERPSAKRLNEGEKELTHICMRLDADEAYTVFEERRNGITMNTMIHYLNQYVRQFNDSEEREDNKFLWASVIPSEDFLTSLGTTEKISSVELFVENNVIGSEYLDLMGIDANSQEDIIMTIKSKPRQSLAKALVQQAFLRIATEGYKASRIRIRGKDINKMSVVIDSLNGKKVDEVTVNLLENGVVDSDSIFSKLEEILGVDL